MRDPKRIEEVLNVIRGVWHTCPDLRLTQLILNSIPHNLNAFYIEDKELVKFLKDYAKEVKYVKGGTKS